MLLEESVILDCPPETAIAFLEDMEARYLEWHPDHVEFRWVTSPAGARHRFFFEEKIGRQRLRATMKITRADDGRFALMVPVNPLLRIVFPWMSFVIDPVPGGSRLIHRIALQLGPIRPFITRAFLEPLREHMREEAVTLRRLTASNPS